MLINPVVLESFDPAKFKINVAGLRLFQDMAAS